MIDFNGVSSNTMMSTTTNRTSVSSRADEEVQESVIRTVIQEKLYVALDKDLKEGKSILLWALQNSAGRKICILHVHQPAKMIPMMGVKFAADKLEEQEVSAYRKLERQKMQTILNEYLRICNRVGVRAEKLHIETDCIEKGIVKVISQYGMRRLVMGAAARRHYSRKMTDLKSKKAIYVHAEASVTCQIWFVCKGHLIYTREGSLDGVNGESMLTVQPPTPNPETEKSNLVIDRSVILGSTSPQNHISPNQNHHIAMSVNYNVHGRTSVEIFSPGCGRGVSTSQSGWESEVDSDEWEGIPRKNFSHGSRFLTCSSSDVPSSVALIPSVRAEGTKGSRDENDIQLLAQLSPKDDTPVEIFSPECGIGVSTSQSGWDSEVGSGKWEGIPRRNFSHGSRLSTCSSSDVPSSLALIPYVRAEGTQGSRDENDIQLLALLSPKDDTPVEIFSPECGRGVSTSQSGWDSEVGSDKWEGIPRRNFSHGSRLSTCSSSDVPSSVALIPYVRAEGTQRSRDENDIQLLALLSPKDDTNQASPPSVLGERVNYELYDQLEQVMEEASKSRRQAFQESVRRGRAEKDTFDAICRAKAAESIYNEELKQRKEVEVALLRERQELEKIQNERDKVRDELQMERDQQSQLESKIAELDETVNELEEKIISAVQLLQNYKKQRDELQIERDNALKVAEDLRQKQAESSRTNSSQFFSEFSFFEIEEATQSFHPSLKIGEGGYGSIYKGLLRHTEVAIKMLNSHSLQGPSEYQQEVDILSKLRHPNLVTLIGACPDVWTLIYEYLPNGSLEDRLSCKDNTPPLSWQTRIRIAAELCSALIFLHSSKPHSIVHGDLKPANVLLDANFVSKLSDFGICRVILPDENARMGTTACYRSDPKGTFAYMDPELFSSGELTTKSDIYSFGVILLRLLTGKLAVSITKEVQYALDNDNLKSLLDYSAGDWPYVQAHQLSHLALRCTEINRKKRPDLGSEVWRVLEAMRASCGGSSSSLRVRSKDPCQAPHYFICPIFQEVMQDPHVAADGFTYEAESLKGWLDSGHDTSPMTNLKLAHKNLVPNLALRSAIQEWLQRQRY